MAAMIVGEKFDDDKDIKTKKINKTFSLSPDDVAFLDSVDRKSAFLGTLLAGYRQGQFIGAETAELLRKYKTLFGADPEDVIRKILARRIERIENNMNALKEAAPAEVKNRVGGAFLKLNRAYEELVAENDVQTDRVQSSVYTGMDQGEQGKTG